MMRQEDLAQQLPHTGEKGQKRGRKFGFPNAEVVYSLLSTPRRSRFASAANSPPVLVPGALCPHLPFANLHLCLFPRRVLITEIRPSRWTRTQKRQKDDLGSGLTGNSKQGTAISEALGKVPHP